MRVVAFMLLGAGLLLYAASMFAPANHDWMGFWWAAYAVDIVARGPRGNADYPLFVLVTAGNLLLILAASLFAFVRGAGAMILAPLLLVATGSALYVAFRYQPSVWGPGFHLWCAALGVMTAALALRAFDRPARPTLASVPLRLVGRPVVERKIGSR